MASGTAKAALGWFDKGPLLAVRRDKTARSMGDIAIPQRMSGFEQVEWPE